MFRIIDLRHIIILILQFYLIQFINRFLNIYYTTLPVIGKVMEPLVH